MKKIKTYVITLSMTFPKSHAKAGRRTFFKEAITNGIDGDHEKYEYQHFKIHTIRHNYELWKKRIDEVNAGKAILSIRQWTGKPYCSKQVEIRQLKKVGIQKLRSMDDNFAYGVSDKGNVLPIPLVLLSINDGLELSDFKEWFKASKPTPEEPLAIIHFTDFKYFE